MAGGNALLQFLQLLTYYNSPSVPELIRGQGYPVEIHPIITDDGYILSMFRIPYGLSSSVAINGTGAGLNNRPVVFMHHGLTSSSADFVMNVPHKALAYRLADAGYDVWLGNCRGNQYSRGHLTLNLNSAAYWDFSWDQIAAYDLPAEINYILHTTGQEQLNYVGYSMGTTVFFAGMNEHPDLMNKIKVMVGVAPAVYVKHMKGLGRIVAPWADLIDIVLHLLGINDVLPGGDQMDALITSICGLPYSLQMSTCISFLAMAFGPEHDQLYQEMLPVALTATPAGLSMHSLLHFAQLVLSGSFRKFDYGSAADNIAHYGQKCPPRYYLDGITVPVAIFNGGEDYLTAPEDVERVRKELPNLIYHKEIALFNHVDFIWGVDADDLVYKDIITIFDMYNF